MTHISPFALWGSGGHQVVSLPPSLGDLFCVTTLLGKGVLVDPVTHYEGAVQRARAFAERLVHPEPVVIKVLCLTFTEAKAMGLAPADLFRDLSPEDEAAMRQQIIANCNDALRNCQDPRVRADALQLLTDLGALR